MSRILLKYLKKKKCVITSQISDILSALYCQILIDHWNRWFLILIHSFISSTISLRIRICEAEAFLSNSWCASSGQYLLLQASFPAPLCLKSGIKQSSNKSSSRRLVSKKDKSCFSVYMSGHGHNDPCQSDDLWNIQISRGKIGGYMHAFHWWHFENEKHLFNVSSLSVDPVFMFLTNSLPGSL